MPLKKIFPLLPTDFFLSQHNSDRRRLLLGWCSRRNGPSGIWHNILFESTVTPRSSFKFSVLWTARSSSCGLVTAEGDSVERRPWPAAGTVSRFPPITDTPFCHRDDLGHGRLS